MCIGNYVHINKIRNFGPEWQHLGTDYLSCFTTAAMICAAAKLIKLDTLHAHPWTCYLILLFKYFYFANVWRCTGLHEPLVIFKLNSFRCQRKKKKNTYNMNTSLACGERDMLHARNCGFGPLPNDSFSCVFWSETSEKSSGSRQNSEPRTETFPKPRPRPVFPRGEGLHIHISVGMFTTSQDPTLFLPHVLPSCDRLSFPSAA